MNLEELLNKSLYVRRPLKEDTSSSAETRWQNKKVLKKYVFYNGDNLDSFSYKSDYPLSISNEYYLNGTSLKIKAKTTIKDLKNRPSIRLYFPLDKNIIKEYNRVCIDIYAKAEGYTGFYLQIGMGDLYDSPSHNPIIIPNKWNHLIFEYEDMNKEKINELVLNPWLTGQNPEGLADYDLYIDNISFEKVEPDYVLGFENEKQISYHMHGYLINEEKIALISKTKEQYFLLYKDEKKVLKKEIKHIDSFLGTDFCIMDFSEIKEAGSYKIKVGNIETAYFKIGSNIYDEGLIKSLNFLNSLRCGTYVEGVHSECHLNCRTYNNKGESVTNFGGWHDAGDVSQFEIPTAEITESLLDLALYYKERDYNLYERIKEEALIGLNWLLKTRFGDGERALSVLYSIWRLNVLEENDESVKSSLAENSPFENFLSAIALIKGYLVFKDSDEIYSKWCKRSAIEDFEFASVGYIEGKYSKRWGPSIPSQTLGCGLLAASLLYEVTKDEKYLKIAAQYADVVMNCQEITDQYGLKGFFYEDVDHKYLLCYEHRGHEQSVITGLVELCKTAKDHPNYPKWVGCLKLYSDYIKDTMHYTKPYNLICGHLYIKNKINGEHFTLPNPYAENIEDGVEKLYKQAQGGIKIKEDVYLRIFPVSLQRRGFFATMLSKTKGLSSIALLLKDYELMKICQDQIAWIFGNNPFASSCMYGIYDNYHPLYVAFSKQIVGSLPVGIMTKKDFDLPFWPTRCNAVYKEIWGHTTAKFLFVICDILKFYGENNE